MEVYDSYGINSCMSTHKHLEHHKGLQTSVGWSMFFFSVMEYEGKIVYDR